MVRGCNALMLCQTRVHLPPKEKAMVPKATLFAHQKARRCFAWWTTITTCAQAVKSHAVKMDLSQNMQAIKRVPSIQVTTSHALQQHPQPRDGKWCSMTWTKASAQQWPMPMKAATNHV